MERWREGWRGREASIRLEEYKKGLVEEKEEERMGLVERLLEIGAGV